MTRSLSPEQKREWEERVRQQKESGQSMLKWCSEQQINYESMLYWRKRFGWNPTKTLERSSFKELSDSSDNTGVTVEYRQVRIHLAKNFDSTVLMQCLRMLKAEKC